MSDYVVTVSVCGGSQAEAANPDVVIGPFATQADASSYARSVYEYCAAKSNTCKREMLAVAKPVVDDLAMVTICETFFGHYWEDEEEEED
jgi:hypothetical protein